jgi:hypothetical protein
MLYPRYALIKLALYSVHDATDTAIAEVKIPASGPHTITPIRKLRRNERRSIAAFAEKGSNRVEKWAGLPGFHRPGRPATASETPVGASAKSQAVPHPHLESRLTRSWTA